MSYVDANPESESKASDEQELQMQGKGRDIQMGGHVVLVPRQACNLA